MVVAVVTVLLAWSLLRPEKAREQPDVVAFSPPTNVVEPLVSPEAVQLLRDDGLIGAVPGSIEDPSGQLLDELIDRSRAHNEMNDRLDAIASLGDVDDPFATLTLRSLLDDQLLAVREEALESLALQRTSASIEGLAYGLTDAERAVRQLAVELLIENGSDAAIGILTLVSNDADVDLRRFTAEELAVADSESASQVLQLFLADTDPVVRDIAQQN